MMASKKAPPAKNIIIGSVADELDSSSSFEVDSSEFGQSFVSITMAVPPGQMVKSSDKLELESKTYVIF